MKLKLVESIITETFDASVDLEYKASDLETDQRVYGTVYYTADDVREDLWNLLSKDSKSGLSEDQFDLLAEDEDAWEDYLKANFDALVEKYYSQLCDIYEDQAREKLYDNWSSYSDESLKTQYDYDRKEYYDIVARGLRLR